MSAKELLCIRWGAGEDRCVRHFDHIGPCRDQFGNDTLTIAAEWLRRGDTHSSDVDPGHIDPWAER